MERDRDRPPNKLQSAIYYALDGDQVNILTMLAQRYEDPWVRILGVGYKNNISGSIVYFRTAYLEQESHYFTLHVREGPGDAHSF